MWQSVEDGHCDHILQICDLLVKDQSPVGIRHKSVLSVPNQQRWSTISDEWCNICYQNIENAQPARTPNPPPRHRNKERSLPQYFLCNLHFWVTVGCRSTGHNSLSTTKMVPSFCNTATNNPLSRTKHLQTHNLNSKITNMNTKMCNTKVSYWGEML